MRGREISKGKAHAAYHIFIGKQMIDQLLPRSRWIIYTKG